MKKVNFLFGVHCHQPVGNFEHIIEEAYQKSYLPFIKVLERHPRIKFSVHYSGILYDWFMEKHPDFIELLSGMVKRGQVEMLTGGYYEPILSIIPDEDKHGQINLENSYIRQVFKYIPRGLWLTERIWEPHLPKALKKADVEYVLVDDYHFISAGKGESDLNGYYITEEEGETLKIFPISKKLRYLIPFRMPEETIRYFHEVSDENGESAAILFDDGEKFGVWPGTHKWVFEEQYLEKLLSEIEKNLDWVTPMTFSEYLDKFPAKGRVYLPSASYFEMMEWALPTNSGKELEKIMRELNNTGKEEEYGKFFKGGFFRNFFVKYPESNLMHKKMLYLSKKLHAIKHGKTIFGGAVEKDERIQKATIELYKGQCNCAYWHGIFGGLYLNYLRNGIYSHLIAADRLMDKYLHGEKSFVDIAVVDFDKDGNEEVVISNNLISLCFSPAYGGSLCEIDYKPKQFNLSNTMARREETYHLKLREASVGQGGASPGSIHSMLRTKERGLDKFLKYDSLQKFSMLDHFFNESETMDNFRDNNYHELGDFAGTNYDFLPNKRGNEASLFMRRKGKITKNSRKIDVMVEKNVSFYAGQSIINVDYGVKNDSQEEIDAYFSVEFNLSLLAGDAEDRYFSVKGVYLEDKRLVSEGELQNITEVRLVDDWQRFSVLLNSEKKMRFWRFPIETVSQSESGFERNYQGSCLVFSWKIRLAPGEKWQNRISLKVEE